MTLKTSLIITGDASVAKKEVADLRRNVVELGTGAKGAVAPVQQLDAALGATATSTREVTAATTAAEKAQNEAATANRTTAAAAAELTQSLGQAAAAQANVTAVMSANAAAQSAQLAVIQAIITEGRQLASVFGILSQAGTASATSLNQVGAAALKASAGTAAVENEARQAANAQAALDGATHRVLQAVDEEALALVRLNALLADAKLALDGGRISQEQFARVQALATNTGNANARSLGSQKAGMFSMGQQMQDVGIQLSMGTDIMRVMAMQGGQLATAIDMMGVKGAGGRAAAFFAGPWGAVILTATAILGPLVAKLFESGEAQDKSTKSGMALVDALGKQKFATDAAREAIKAYTEQQDKGRKGTELATRLSLAEAEADIKRALATREATKAKLEALQADSLNPYTANGGTAGAGGSMLTDMKAASVAASLKQQTTAINQLLQARRDLLVQVGTADGEAAADPLKAIDLKYNLQRQQAEAAAASNTKLARSIDDTVKAIERRRTVEKNEEQERQRKLNEKPRQVSLGNQIEATSAANILATAERYKGLSENKSGDRAQLSDLFKQANVNVDPTMVAWCAAFVNSVLAANGVKGTGSLAARSFLGFGQSTDTPNKGDIVVSKRGNNAAQGHVGFYQGTDAKGNVLVLGGNTGDKVATSAIARSNVLGFRKAPTAADSYKDTQQAAETAAKEQQRALEQVVAKYLPATAAAKEYADELARIDALAKSYDGKNATSGLTAEQATAARVALKTANDKKMAEISLTPEAKAAADAKKSIDGVVQSLGFELAARKSLDPVQRAMAQHQDELAKLSDTERQAYEAKLKSLYAQDDAYKAVEDATRAAAEAQRQFRDMALDAFDAIVLGGENAGKVIDRLAQTIASAAIEAAVLGTGPLAALLKGGGTAAPVAAAASGGSTGQAAADLVGKSVGKSVGDRLDGVFGKGNSGKILQNAGFGYTAASITGGNGIGGGIGGAVGGKIAEKAFAASLGKLGGLAGPLGSIAGGILGGVVGKLIAGKPKEYGSSAISFDGGVASAGAAIGKGTSEREKASALGGSVADGLNKIAQQLGGALGSANVSIGYRPGHKAGAYRVDTSGGGKVTGVEAFETEAEAIAFAIRDAITDGAVTGLSAAVQKAINSSTDVDKALSEALKVQDLELTMGGITGEIDKAFREFEATAKERVRIATTYGFDLVAIEKRNGEDRAKLAQQLATEQVGSLKKLIEEMTQGSLFEGTAVDRLAAINTAIAKAKTDLDNGVAGAGDTLANLYAQRLATSKEVNATTSGYAADRAATLDEARAAVAKANATIAKASGGTSDPALATTNAVLKASAASLDEANDQNAQMLSAMKEQNVLLTAIVKNNASGKVFDMKALTAY